VRFLIDTNVVSELRKGRQCDASVAAWYEAVPPQSFYMSVLGLGEIRKGIELARPRDPEKAQRLATWLAAVEGAFGDRIIPVDRAVADMWGQMNARRPIPVIDGMLAATARVHDLTLVTRNSADVAGLGAKILNPFEPQRAL
jgi:toxin FitB